MPDPFSLTALLTVLSKIVSDNPKIVIDAINCGVNGINSGVNLYDKIIKPIQNAKNQETQAKRFDDFLVLVEEKVKTDQQRLAIEKLRLALDRESVENQKQLIGLLVNYLERERQKRNLLWFFSFILLVFGVFVFRPVSDNNLNTQPILPIPAPEPTPAPEPAKPECPQFLSSGLCANDKGNEKPIEPTPAPEPAKPECPQFLSPGLCAKGN